jgi:uncharacterized RDD family membrane protein YckC
VVVVLGETEGLRWEYDLLARTRWIDKTMFVVPPVRGSALRKALTVFRKYTDAWGVQVVGRVGADVVLFAPGGKGRLIPLHSPGLRTRNRTLAPSTHHYREPIAEILARASAPAQKSTLPQAVSVPSPVSARTGRQAVPEVAVQGLRLTEPITEAASVVLRRRAGALFVDWAISVLVFSLLALVVWVGFDPSILSHPSGSKEADEVNRQVTTVGTVLSPVYFLIVEGLLGVSLGKRWFGLRVLTCDDTVPTWPQRFRRGLIKAGSMFICVFPLAALSGVQGTVWHDRGGKTKVVACWKY